MRPIKAIATEMPATAQKSRSGEKTKVGINGLLTSEASTASHASNTLKELIDFHIRRNCLTIDNESVDDEVKHSMESSAVKSTCAIFEMCSAAVLEFRMSKVWQSYLHCSANLLKVIQEELQAYAHGCWGLLPAFCRHPTDTYQNFGSLVKPLITFITKDSFMLENIAIALQVLVNQNKTVVRSNVGTGAFATLPKTSEINGSSVVFESKPPYSKKIASRNIRALASCSKELVQALVDVFFGSPPEKRAYLKVQEACHFQGHSLGG